jgi:hypothetical protein
LEGVGRIGNDRGQGFCLHSCLALEAHRGAVLGLAGQRFWARREPAPAGETRTQRAQRRTEADLWAEMLESIGPAPEGATWVSVADRGADVYSHLAGARALNWHCVVRACQDRALEDGGYLLQQVRALAPRSQRPVRVRLGKQGPKKRLLQVAWCAVHLRPPKGPAGRGLPPEGLPVWVIRVWDETLEWVLVSTLPVEDAAAAAERLDWYSRRWSIEDYHKGLKTGCRIEASQLLRTAERFGALLGFAAIVAVRLLQLRDRARQAPGAPVAESELSQKVLAARLQVAPEAVATNLGFWRGVAQLGGFLGRKGDGEPGWQSLWRGWQELQLLLQGVELAQTLQEKCG